MPPIFKNNMKPAQYLPTILIMINIATAAIYGFDGDWRKVIYWGAAAALTASITF